MNFLENANLPDKKVGLVCISKNAKDEIKEGIKKLNIKMLFTPSVAYMKSPVRSHADIVFHHIGGNNFVCEPSVYEYFSKAFRNSNANIICGKTFLEDIYPNDCYYNVARVCDRLFMKVVDSSILDFEKNNYTRKINVRQGYCKCSICIVNSNAIITSDDGIFKSAVKNGFDVLKICNGYIEIDAYDYGFIGGATGLISKDIMAFCGDIKTHPDCDNICSFLRNYNIYAENLAKGLLFDVGSILPIAYE